jgi:hypothetical protein
MKIFLLVAACCAFAFAGCERHPASQVQQLNEREHSEASPEKKKDEANPEQAHPEASATASLSPRTYFPPNSK